MYGYRRRSGICTQSRTKLDPAGIAARDLRECLLLQIERIQEGNITLFTAKKERIILKNSLKNITIKFQKKLEIEDVDLKEAIDAIIRLNPKHGGSLKDNIKMFNKSFQTS